jgi:hypothetical protein
MSNAAVLVVRSGWLSVFFPLFFYVSVFSPVPALLSYYILIAFLRGEALGVYGS